MTLTRPRQLLLALALGGLNILATSADTAERTAESNVADWRPVAEALGRPGTLLPGDIYRVGLPRTDLTVTVQGVQVKAGFALGSYAAFKKMGASAMVMGDLVLLDPEVNPVMSGLQERGLPFISTLWPTIRDCSTCTSGPTTTRFSSPADSGARRT